jgi:hypothetical protein
MFDVMLHHWDKTLNTWLCSCILWHHWSTVGQWNFRRGNLCDKDGEITASASINYSLTSQVTAVGIHCADHATPSTRKRLALTSPTKGGRLVNIVHLRTMATEFSFLAAQYTVKQACGLKEEIQIKSCEGHLSVVKTWRGCTAHR